MVIDDRDFSCTQTSSIGSSRKCQGLGPAWGPFNHHPFRKYRDWPTLILTTGRSQNLPIVVDNVPVSATICEGIYRCMSVERSQNRIKKTSSKTWGGVASSASIARGAKQQPTLRPAGLNNGDAEPSRTQGGLEIARYATEFCNSAETYPGRATGPLGFILQQTFARSQRRTAGSPAMLRNLLFGTRRAKVGV